MGLRRRSVNLNCRLKLEQLETRLTPAGLNAPPALGAFADTQVMQTGPIDHMAIRPLMAAVAAVGIFVVWDHRTKRLSPHGQQPAK